MHERLHRAVQVLRVGAVRVDRHVQHARLLAQLRDRVDLAVVAEHRERLNALEGGPGVRGVAVVADHRGRLGPLVEQVRVVLAEHGWARPSPCRRRSRWRRRPRARPAPAPAPRSARSRGAPRRSGRRPARRSAPPRGLWGRGRSESTTSWRSASTRSPKRLMMSRARALVSSALPPLRAMKMWPTTNCGSSARCEACPPARISSAQILRGMSSSTPQPSPSPSTLPARWSIFWSAVSAVGIGSWRGVASFSNGGVERAGVLVLHRRRRTARTVPLRRRVAN